MTVTVFGSINIDAVLRVGTLPRPGETVRAIDLSYHPGGKGANQAVAAARFGARTHLIGAVGDDAHGNTMRHFLRENGVDVSAVRVVPGPTGFAQICVADSGQNQIVVVAGANAAVRAPADLEVAEGGGRPILLAQLELPVGEVAIALREARRAGMLTILNTAPALREAEALLEDVDLLILNETEFSFYLGTVLPVGASEIGHAARRLRRREDQRIVVTLGEAGMVALVGEQVIAIPAARVKVIDTVGAGDCFCGVLAAALSENISFAEAIALAGCAASLSVQRTGAAPSMPTRAEIQKAIAEGVSGESGPTAN